MRRRYDALDFDVFNEQLTGLIRAASIIIESLKGTAQDRTRPTRYLAHRLWSKWLELGFPVPRLVRGADHLNADAPDEDAFVETIRLLIDAMHTYRKPSDKGRASSARARLITRTLLNEHKPSDGEVTYVLRTVIEAGRKKLRARE
jgi:hypothetical protein